MPDKTISILSTACCAMVLAYIAMIIVTMYFATWQTDLASRMTSTESAITLLETNYYGSISKLDAIDPHTLGYVTPEHVDYAAMAHVTALTFAGN